MGAVGRTNIRLCGSHAGVSIGQDGPSQMALEDLAMMRAVFGSTVLYPSDGVSAAHLVNTMAETKGISYMRTTREKTPILYQNDDKFPVGGSKVLRSSKEDKATIVEAGINVRVIDAYSVKPIDSTTLWTAAEDTGVIITVEDHWPEGGLGDAVLESFSDFGKARGNKQLPRVIKLAVKSMPGSGTPAELIDAAGISARCIVEAVQSLNK
jgi:transketolase